MSRRCRPVRIGPPKSEQAAALAVAALLDGSSTVIVAGSESQAEAVFEAARAQMAPYRTMPECDPLGLAQLEERYRCEGGPS